MRLLASQIFLIVSAVAAVALGFSVLRGLLLFHFANIPEETEYFVVPASDFGWRLLASLSPLLLYVGSIALNRAWAWSRFGKAAFFVHVIYTLILFSEWAYATWLLRSISRNG